MFWPDQLVRDHSERSGEKTDNNYTCCYGNAFLCGQDDRVFHCLILAFIIGSI